jgi:YVTN family beta-propeller protein
MRTLKPCSNYPAGWLAPLALAFAFGCTVVAGPAALASPLAAAELSAGPAATLPSTVRVGSDPVAIATDDTAGLVWVANAGDNTVTKISMATRQVMATVKVGSPPSSLAVFPGTGTVWVGSQTTNVVSVFSESSPPATATTTYQFGTPADAPLLVAGRQGPIAIASASQGLVWLINPTTGHVSNPYAVGGTLGGIATFVQLSQVWVTDSSADTAVDVTNPQIPSVTVGQGPTGLAYDPGTSTLWVANQASGTLSEIAFNGFRGQVVATYKAGSNNFAIAADPSPVIDVDPLKGYIWLADTSGSTVSELSEATGQVVQTITVGSGPDAIAVVPYPESIWVANKNDGTVTVLSLPEFTSPSSLTVTAGSPVNFQVTTSGYPASTITALELPRGLTLSQSGLLSGTPARGSGQVYQVPLQAYNGLGRFAFQTLTLTVNEAPFFEPVENPIQLTVGEIRAGGIYAYGYPAPTVTVSGKLPAGVTYSCPTPSEGNLTVCAPVGTPNPGTGGTYPITLTATNGIGSPVTLQLAISVNQLPRFTSPSHLRVRAGHRVRFRITTTGFPAPVLKVSGKLPAHLKIKIYANGNALISGTPARSARGHTYKLTIRASNGAGSPVTQVVVIKVS